MLIVWFRPSFLQIAPMLRPGEPPSVAVSMSTTAVRLLHSFVSFSASSSSDRRSSFYLSFPFLDRR